MREPALNRSGVSGDFSPREVGVMAASTSKRYPPELRERAVRMVTEIAGDHGSEWAAMNEVARLLGIGTADTVRKRVRQGEVDASQRPGATTDESAELKRLRRQRASRRSGYPTLSGGRRVIARQRPGLDDQRPLQDRADQETRTMARRRPRRDRRRRVGRLVQPPSPVRVLRRPPAGRDGSLWLDVSTALTGRSQRVPARSGHSCHTQHRHRPRWGRR